MHYGCYATFSVCRRPRGRRGLKPPIKHEGNLKLQSRRPRGRRGLKLYPGYRVVDGAPVAAHGALAMTTPGDTTMATLAEVRQVMKGFAARIARYRAVSVASLSRRRCRFRGAAFQRFWRAVRRGARKIRERL